MIVRLVVEITSLQVNQKLVSKSLRFYIQSSVILTILEQKIRFMLYLLDQAKLAFDSQSQSEKKKNFEVL